jgi:small subunit ribosomal protein S18
MRGLKSNKPRKLKQVSVKQFRRKVLSLSQLLSKLRKQRQRGVNSVDQKRASQKPIKPIIPPKTLVIILKEKPEQQLYNRRIIDYKHSGLLQRYIGLGGKILPRRQTRLTAKQQRFVAKTIKTARVMGLLPFVSKERGFLR